MNTISRWTFSIAVAIILTLIIACLTAHLVTP
jgi:p-aminobenzoyl-glutamate transporter AbgT